MDDPEHIDCKKSKLLIKVYKIPEKIKKVLEKTKQKQRSNMIFAGCTFLIITSVFTIYKVNEIKTRAFAVYFGDEKVGITREEKTALSVLGNIKKELTDTYNLDIIFNQDIRFEGIHSKKDLLTSAKDLEKNIKSKLTFLVNGYVLIIDGKEIGATETKEEIEELIDEFKQPYIKDKEEDKVVKESGFIEEIKIENKNIPLNRIMDKDKIFQYIQTGSEEIKEHTVEVGESLWTIASIYKIPVDDLIIANGNIEPEKLQIGDKVKLLVPKPMLTVETIEEIKYKEKINYEVKVEQNNNMYKNEKQIKVEGVPGESQVLAKVTKHNGIVVNKEVINENITKKPVDELVVRGTKEPPRTVATGSFLMPTRGTISSRYGVRNGRMHKGLDIAARPGTPIKAADGGTISFAGRRGAYGNLVEINHGNGYKTKYAHCSTINVKVGQKVYKGQVIAGVGNTGRSTGPHLHFEILKNESNINPSSNIR